MELKEEEKILHTNYINDVLLNERWEIVYIYNKKLDSYYYKNSFDTHIAFYEKTDVQDFVINCIDNRRKRILERKNII